MIVFLWLLEIYIDFSETNVVSSLLILLSICTNQIKTSTAMTPDIAKIS